MAGEVALDAAAYFLAGLAFGAAALDVGQGGRVIAHPGDGDDVQGPVELAVAEANEPVPAGAAGGHRDRRRSRQHGERCLAADPPGVGPGQQDLRGAERADAVLAGDQAGARFSAMAAIWASMSAAAASSAATRPPSRIRVWYWTRVSRSASG